MCDDRRRAIRDLTELRSPIRLLLARMAGFDWDFPRTLVTLTIDDVLRATELHQSGVLSDGELEDWAETIQGRDEVEFDQKSRDLLSEVIFELSTPDLYGPMPAIVASVQERLS